MQRCSAGTPGVDSTGYRKYGVESGVVEYDNSDGNVRQTLYFDRYGAREALYTTLGPSSDSSAWPFRVIVQDGEWRYAFNPDSESGRKSGTMSGHGALMGALPHAWGDPVRFAGAGAVTSLAGKEVVGKMAAGYRYSMHGERYEVWAWERIPLDVTLRWSSDPRETPTILRAVQVTVGVEIPPERFRIPKNVRFEDPI